MCLPRVTLQISKQFTILHMFTEECVLILCHIFSVQMSFFLLIPTEKSIGERYGVCGAHGSGKPFPIQ
jgi:hypothetical protein